MKTFSARETAWLQELDGLELAGFRRRAFAFVIDWALISMILTLSLALGSFVYMQIAHHFGGPTGAIDIRSDTSHFTLTPDGAPHSGTAKGIHYQLGFPEDADPAHPRSVTQYVEHKAPTVFGDLIVPVLYFGLFLWKWNGQTPGKRWMKIRVVSLVHRHMTFWHSVERALGYGAAALEAGFGFFQFWLHPYRRCAQDRLAETIVVTERSYKKRLGSG